MTFNIHHAEGADKKVDLQRIVEVIKSEKADVVVLQEVDRNLERSQHLDMPARLAELTGLSCIFSNNFHVDQGEYGNAVLSRFPVVAWTNSHFDKLAPCEQRGLLQLTLDVEGNMLRVANTHLDAQHEDAERLHQVGQIKQMLAAPGKAPLLLAGDFNATPQSDVHHLLSENWIDVWPLIGEGTGNTIPVPRATRRIDYIWIEPNSPLRPKRAWLAESLGSDHLPLVVEFWFSKAE